MTPEDFEDIPPDVKEVYDALIVAAPYGYAGYERLRRRIISERGYDAFFDLQSEAFRLIAKGSRP